MAREYDRGNADEEWAGLIARVQQLEAERTPPMLESVPTNDTALLAQPENSFSSTAAPIYYPPDQGPSRQTISEWLYERRRILGIALAAAILGGGAGIGVKVAQSDRAPINQETSARTDIQPSQPVEPELIAPAPSSSADMPSISPTPESFDGSKDKKKHKDNKPNKPDKEPSVASERFKFGTFNIFHSTGNGARDWQRRARLSVAAINRFDVDVVSLQEARMNQQRFIDNITSTDAQKKKKTDIFDIFPYDAKKFGFKGNDRIEQFTPNPIMWDRTKFSFIKYETTDVRYFGGSIKKAYAVLLENKTTGGKTWFVSFHDPADAKGDAKKLRLSNAKEYKSWWAELAKTAPVVAGGDANSGLQLRYGNNDTVDNNPENLSCEIIVEGGSMAYASDVLKHSDMKDRESFLDKVHSDCSSTDMLGGDPIDLIFTSTRGDSRVDVHAYKKSGKGRSVNGSDVHPLYAVTLSTPNQ